MNTTMEPIDRPVEIHRALMRVGDALARLAAARPELRRIKYTPDGMDPQPLTGTCYYVSEALWHLGAKLHGYMPWQGKVLGVSHWCLKHPHSGRILDATSAQFQDPDRPGLFTAEAFGALSDMWGGWGEHRGFMTSKPSKRAQVLIDAYLAREEMP